MYKRIKTILGEENIINFFDQYLSLPNTKTSKSESEYKLEMSVPGLSKADLSIKVENGVLVISNETQSFFTGAFNKQYDIPEEVNVDEISAEFNNGVLIVILPLLKIKKPTITIAIK